MGKKKPDKRGVVYSTNPDFEYEQESEEASSLPPAFQTLYISLDRKARKGKEVTLIENFQGPKSELEELAREAKKKFGLGGSVEEDRILLQGNVRDQVTLWLEAKGFKTKRKGG